MRTHGETKRLAFLVEDYLLLHPYWPLGLAIANIISEGGLKASLTYITDAEWVEALDKLTESLLAEDLQYQDSPQDPVSR